MIYLALRDADAEVVREDCEGPSSGSISWPLNSNLWAALVVE